MSASEGGDSRDVLRIVCVSDLHGGHDRLELPEGDLLLIAGDVTQGGTLEQLATFNQFLERVPHDVCVLIAGNHDVCFQDEPDRARNVVTNARYLEDESLQVGGFHLYGSPWQPHLIPGEASPWAFDLPRGEALARKWRAIPEDVDILVTHSPPHGVRDEIYTGDAIGCRELRDRVVELGPALHVFGHVHERPGIEELGETLCVNASCPGGYGSPAVVDLSPDGNVEVVDAGDRLPDWIRERMERRAAESR